jgi:glycosyltransferase involved in cell wall biosynthesis
MSKIKLSVIIPCYNVENYVEKCINSLLQQTLNDIEIIVVNDGSKDNTLKILKKLVKENTNIKLIDKKNAGVSAARNDALKIAKGEYIGFLDSDDWVEKDMFEKMYNKAIKENLDIVACDTNAVYPDKNIIIKSNISESSTPQELMLNAYAVIWNKIYKREILKGIEFKEGMTFCEDVLFLYMIYSRVNKVGSIEEPLHYYLQREGSLTYTYDKKLYQLIDSLDNVVDFYKKEKKLKKYHDEIEYSYVRYLYATFIKRLAKTKNKEEFKKGISYVIKKVNETFPKYKKNKYINTLKPKNIYLKYFNKFIANIIFNLEKNKMN